MDIYYNIGTGLLLDFEFGTTWYNDTSQYGI